MRRICCLVAVMGLFLANVGCIAVVGNKGKFSTCDRQVVERNGTLYVVDVQTGDVMKVDEDRIASATPLTAEEGD